jgi:hypothetical protein
VFFQLSAVGPVRGEDDLALHGDDNLGLGSGAEFREVEGFHFLLIDEDDVYSFLKFVDDAGLQIFIARDEGLAVAAPSRVHIDDQQLRVLFIVIAEKVLCVSDHSGQLQLLSLLSHLI